MRIVVDDLLGSQISEFLEEHVQQMRSITPPASKHALDLDSLRRPEITFWSVMDRDTLVGCGAIKRLDASHAEVKSMRTKPARQQSGIASLLLEYVITEARRMDSPGSVSKPARPGSSCPPGSCTRSSDSNTAGHSRIISPTRTASS